jgi:hypothetical protein
MLFLKGVRVEGTCARRAGAFLLAFAIAYAGTPQQAFGKLLPETRKLQACFRLADWTLAAGEALRAGLPQVQHLAAHADEPPAERAGREEASRAVYRDRPGDLSDYIAARLSACLREYGVAASDRFAKACYDRTLWAGMLFASKRRGDDLERLIQGYERAGIPISELARTVYGTARPEAEFRAELFADCIGG